MAVMDGEDSGGDGCVSIVLGMVMGWDRWVGILVMVGYGDGLCLHGDGLWMGPVMVVSP